MKARLNRITTRTGDTGSTGLADGGRLSKTHPRVVAMGDVDELNSHLGFLAAGLQASPLQPALRPYRDMIQVIQNDLFDLGAGLSLPGHAVLRPDQLAQLDHWIEAENALLPPLTEFVLPGGSELVARGHLSRTVARRAERSVFALGESGPEGEAGQYLNRLSDLLFVVTRRLAQIEGCETPLWRGTQAPNPD